MKKLSRFQIKKITIFYKSVDSKSMAATKDTLWQYLLGFGLLEWGYGVLPEKKGQECR